MKRLNIQKLNAASDRELNETLLKAQVYANARLSAISNWLTLFGVILILAIVLSIFSGLLSNL